MVRNSATVSSIGFASHMDNLGIMKGMHISIMMLVVLLATFRNATAQDADYRSEYTSAVMNDSITADDLFPESLRAVLAYDGTKVLYLISASDCNVCLSHLKSFDAIARNVPNVQQHVTLFETAPPLARRLLAEYGLQAISTSAGTTGDSLIARAMKVRKTPVCYVLDRNNRIIAYDKIGGSEITTASIARHLLPEMGLERVRDIPLSFNGTEYVSGRLLYLSHDARSDHFYAYDFTFQTLLRLTTEGAILSQLKADPSGYPFMRPKGLQAGEAGSGNELVMFDFALPSQGRFAIRTITFPGTGADTPVVQSQYFTHRRTVTDTPTLATTVFDVRTDPQPKDLLSIGGARLVSLMPGASHWSDPQRLQNFVSLARLREAEPGRLVYEYPGPGIGPDSAFMACFNVDSVDRTRNPPLTYPSLLTLPENRVGLYFKEINKLHILDTLLRPITEVTLHLDDFVAGSGCPAKHSSRIDKIIPCHNGMLVLYRAHAFTPESNYTKANPTYHLQYLDSLGHPRTRPLTIPHDIYFEESCRMPDGTFCAVTHTSGAFGLALLKLTGLP